MLNSVKAVDRDQRMNLNTRALNPIDESGEVEFKVQKGFKINPTPLGNEVKKLVPGLETLGGTKAHNRTFDKKALNDWRSLNRSTECTTYTSSSKDMKKFLVSSYFKPNPNTTQTSF